MTIDLKAIQRALELQEAASPAPWYSMKKLEPSFQDHGYRTVAIPTRPAGMMIYRRPTFGPDGGWFADFGNDANFIAHAHTTTDQLRDAVKLLQVAKGALAAVYPEMQREHDAGDGHFSTAEVDAVRAALASLSGIEELTP